jgi:RNA polymerase sigma-70 factor (ECF subfamily)
MIHFMNTTSLSLLDRLKGADPNAADWQRLKDIYQPLIRSWLSGVPGLREEVDDLAQDVLIVLLRGLPSFERRRHGSFRAWLRQVATNRVRAFWKANRKRSRHESEVESEKHLAQLEDPTSDLARQWDREHDQHVLNKLLAAVQPDFEPNTWRAFTQFALDGLPAADVARELSMSETAIVQAKFRVLKRLREEAGDLMS